MHRQKKCAFRFVPAGMIRVCQAVGVSAAFTFAHIITCSRVAPATSTEENANGYTIFQFASIPPRRGPAIPQIATIAEFFALRL